MTAVTDHMYNPVPRGVLELKLGRAKITDAGVAELPNQTQRNIANLLSLHPPDRLRKIVNDSEPQVSQEISHISTQITQLSPRLIL